MNITISIVISVVAYVLGAITKMFVFQIPNKYIPIQNVIIGLISAIVCFIAKLDNNFLNILVSCLLATMGAGGLSDLVNGFKKKD